MMATAPSVHHDKGVSSSSSSTCPFPAAMDVLHLLGYVLNMWSRHRESLRAMACGGDLREEDVRVVGQLGKELRELWEEERMNREVPYDQEETSSSSSSDEAGDEDRAEGGGHHDPSFVSSSLVPEGEEQGQVAASAKAKKRKRSSRRKRSRKSSQSSSSSSSSEGARSNPLFASHLSVSTVANDRPNNQAGDIARKERISARPGVTWCTSSGDETEAPDRPDHLHVSRVVKQYSVDPDGLCWPWTLEVHRDPFSPSVSVTIGCVQASSERKRGGSGNIVLGGVNLEDVTFMGGATVAQAFIRLRAFELLKILGSSINGYYHVQKLREQSDDIILMSLPVNYVRRGASGSVAYFLAILQHKLRDIVPGFRLRCGIAVTGVMTTSGVILPVADIAIKVVRALKEGASLVLVPCLNEGEVKEAIEEANKLREEFARGGTKAQKGGEKTAYLSQVGEEKALLMEVLTEEQVTNKVRFVMSALDVLEHATDGGLRIFYKAPAEIEAIKKHYVDQFTRNPVLENNLGLSKNICSHSYCGALAFDATVKGVREDGKPDYVNYNFPTFAEATAVPSYPRSGRIIMPGLVSSGSSRVRSALITAVSWVKIHTEELTILFNSLPYIDLERCVRQHQELPGTEGGKGERGEGGRGFTEYNDVDIILHVPPNVDSAYLAPSLILAIIAMMWRRSESFNGWSVVATIDVFGQMVGSSGMDDHYLSDVQRLGYTHLVAAPSDVECIRKSCEDAGVDMESYGVKVVGCEAVMDMVRQAFVVGASGGPVDE